MDYKALSKELISRIRFLRKYQQVNLETIGELQEQISALKDSIIESEEERNGLENERDEALCDAEYWKGEHSSIECQMDSMEDINEMNVHDIAAHLCGEYGGSMMDLLNMEQAILDNMPKHLGTNYRFLA